tara:strand:+ start:6350 stop:6676 length:327 start_codon:yes stop_codon:yes gene_type:complete
MKSFLSLLGFIGATFAFILACLTLFALGCAIKVRYPEPLNFVCYGFYADSTYVRTSERNPYTSPNHSDKDTLVLTSIQGAWLKFDNGEMYKLHSDSLDLYFWDKLNKQ